MGSVGKSNAEQKGNEILGGNAALFPHRLPKCPHACLSTLGMHAKLL